MHYRI